MRLTTSGPKDVAKIILCFAPKDAMTVKTQKKTEKLQTAKIIIKLYISEMLVKKQSF